MRNDSWTRRKRQRPTMLNNDRAGARGRLRQTCESLKRRRFVAARANGCLSGYVSATTGVAQIAAELLRRPSRQCRAMCGRLRVGKSFLHGVQQWSEQPCVRPVSAVHVTAGHNALRGSGPGQFHAFDHAVARVGCPDRRIDRLCITCCSPFPTVTSRRMPDAISFTPRVRRVPCSARPWSSLPKPFGPSCWQARWQQPWWAAAPTTP